MKALVKIPRDLLVQALEDLERPHQFAGERLGFFSFREAKHGSRPFILCYDYHSIPDEHYTYDKSCGGRINGVAIQVAMGRALRDDCGQLWVHTHGRRGHPGPSSTDLHEGPKVVQSLANAHDKRMQGWSIISENGVWGQIRATNGVLYDFEDLAVIGYPMILPRRNAHAVPKRGIAARLLGVLMKKYGAESAARYDRQSFLGENAQAILESCKVTIAGLGGGGSHISQQLAHIGFQNVILCDRDRVEFTNLNRLVGATCWDVVFKRHKTFIASRLFRGLQPNAHVDDRPLNWQDKIDEVRESDIVFGSIDSFDGRRQLEAFCRAHLIPFIDIGMVVNRPQKRSPEIYGQTVLSMPGKPCMHCLRVLTKETLSAEIQDYNAGVQPQVVWPNGILASTAVGEAIALLTGWSDGSIPAAKIDLRGSRLTMSDSKLAPALEGTVCSHYPLSEAGDPLFTKL